VLLAIGLPPVTANVSNTLGLLPGGASGSLGYRSELRTVPRLTLTVVASAGIGAVAGATLLLLLPPSVFEAVVPWLILLSCLLVGVQPVVSRWTRRRTPHAAVPRTAMGPLTTLGATVTGVYGGYFGAGAGVKMIAVHGLGLDVELRVLNALKTLSLMSGNLIAAVIFVVAADPDWAAVLPLAAGSVVGGYVGARVGRRLPAPLLRGLIVVAGVVAFVLLLG
jgi:uncharacterized membrane protein YfcA